MTLDDVLRKNEQLRNIHAGKRCFLVGNGPSLNSQDLKLLKDEVAIVATSFFRHPDAKVINPSYWVFADPYFWQEPEKHFMPAMNQAIQKGVATKLFVPTGGFPFFSAFNAGPLIDLHFYHYDQSRESVAPIDFSQGIPQYGQNVMTVCLMLALYLQCNPIYFIGCDRDYTRVTKEEYEDASIIHFYSEGVNKFSSYMPWEQWDAAMKRTNYEYDKLRAYGDRWGFDIYNATAGGCFDVFPRVQYESLFARSVDLIGKKAQTEDITDIIVLGRSAVKLMNEGAAGSSLEILKAALRRNLNTRNKIDGLEYLMALCLSKLGVYDRAMIYAREDLTRNSGNQEKTMLLIKQLGRYI